MKHSQNDLKRKRDERNGCDTFHKCDYSKSAVSYFFLFSLREGTVNHMLQL